MDTVKETDIIVLTRTQRKMMLLLSDCKPHHIDELRKCLYNDDCEQKVAVNHIYLLKKRIRQYGQTIVSVLYENNLYYRWVPKHDAELYAVGEQSTENEVSTQNAIKEQNH